MDFFTREFMLMLLHIAAGRLKLPRDVCLSRIWVSNRSSSFKAYHCCLSLSRAIVFVIHSSPIPITAAENPSCFNCSTWSLITETNGGTTIMVDKGLTSLEHKALETRGNSWNIKLFPKPVGRMAKWLSHELDWEGTLFVPSWVLELAENIEDNSLKLH